MAVNRIFVHTDASGHRKILRLSIKLGIPEIYALGVAVQLWLRTMHHEYYDGKWKGWAKEEIARDLGWTGKPEELIAALIDTQLLEADADGYVARNFPVRQGDMVWKRAHRAKYMREYRARIKAGNDEEEVDEVPNPVKSVSATPADRMTELYQRCVKYPLQRSTIHRHMEIALESGITTAVLESALMNPDNKNRPPWLIVQDIQRNGSGDYNRFIKMLEEKGLKKPPDPPPAETIGGKG